MASKGQKLRYTYRYKDVKKKFTTLRHAKYFNLYFGRVLLLANEPFLKSHRKSDQKAKYIQRFIKRLNKLLIEEARRHDRELKRRAKKPIARKKAIKKAETKRYAAKKADRDAKRVKAKRAKKPRKIIEYEQEILEEEFLNEQRSRREKSKQRPDGVIGLVKITPVKSKSVEYKKEIVEKTIMTRFMGSAKIKILDFTLKQPVEVDHSNCLREMERLQEVFTPHIEKAFKESTKFTNNFIFRVKFNIYTSKKTLRSSGYGGERLRMNKLENLLKYIYSIMNELCITSKNYINMSATGFIQITGFTLENVLRAEKNDS